MRLSDSEIQGIFRGIPTSSLVTFVSVRYDIETLSHESYYRPLQLR